MAGIDKFAEYMLLRRAVPVWACLLVFATVAWAVPDEPASDFSFKLEELRSGDEVTFDELCAALPLVVHVWAPDCPYCLAQMPYAAAFYRKLDHDEVNYVTLSITGAKADILDYLQDHRLKFDTLWGGDGEVGESYYDGEWPVTYVFAAGGELAGTCDITGPAYLTEMMELVEAVVDLAGAGDPVDDETAESE